jgi:hypothetical protein
MVHDRPQLYGAMPKLSTIGRRYAVVVIAFTGAMLSGQPRALADSAAMKAADTQRNCGSSAGSVSNQINRQPCPSEGRVEQGGRQRRGAPQPEIGSVPPSAAPVEGQSDLIDVIQPRDKHSAR